MTGHGLGLAFTEHPSKACDNLSNEMFNTDVNAFQTPEIADVFIRWEVTGKK